MYSCVEYVPTERGTATCTCNGSTHKESETDGNIVYKITSLVKRQFTLLSTGITICQVSQEPICKLQRVLLAEIIPHIHIGHGEKYQSPPCVNILKYVKMSLSFEIDKFKFHHV